MSEQPKDKLEPESPEHGVTRRTFLKTSGLGAAAVTVLSTGVAALPDGMPKVVGPGAVPITLKINGKALQTEVTPATTLAEALRGPLNHSGTKVVCDRGACSACTVWLDGTPVNSCMTLAVDVGDREVRTIEGLASGNALHPVQAAFIEHDATQCGYCTPGMVMSCAALLEHNPNPTEADVRQATSGNLCRCGTYPKVFEATLAAAGRKGRKA
jgi:xanthine dehydrogenase YagT iron-sulfur-binding subunit